MSCYAGPDIIEDGLVLCLDAANSKSFRGEPTTNVINNPTMEYGWSNVSNYDGSSITLTYEEEDGIPHLKLSNGTFATNGNNAGYPRINGSFSGTLSDGWSLSFEAKGSDGDKMILSFYAPEGTRYTAYADLTTEWKRYEFNNIITGFTFNDIYLRAGLYPEKTKYIRRIQAEQKPYATPFINGTRGTTVATGGGFIDLSGSENHGTLYERTLGLKAYSNYIDFPDPTGSIGYQYGYLRSNIPTGPISYTAIISFYPYSVSGEKHLFRTSNNFGANINSGRIQYYTTNYNVETAYTPNNSVLENNWYFFSLVYDRDSSKHIAYINGKFASEKQHSIQYSITNGYQNWGARDDTYAAGLNGRIGNVLMYDRPLSAEENMQIFNAYRGRYGI